MIQQRNAQKLRSCQQLARQINILRAGFNITRRMVMSNNNPRRSVANYLSENLTGGARVSVAVPIVIT